MSELRATATISELKHESQNVSVLAAVFHDERSFPGPVDGLTGYVTGA